MTRDIPRTKRISEVKLVTDLNDGERAVPDTNLVYGLRSTRKGEKFTGVVVKHVTRCGFKIFAMTTDGAAYAIGGGSRYSLVPKNRRREKSSAASKMVPKPRSF